MFVGTLSGHATLSIPFHLNFLSQVLKERIFAFKSRAFKNLSLRGSKYTF